tara:strand:+ start:33585 stop:34283 length:699 start_codon:yes stop_codon:yes gene_type:complete
MENNIQYNALANLFRYPTEDYFKHVKECGEILKDYYPKAYENFKKFQEIIDTKNSVELEELFSMTFHIQAICYLDLGYVLYAEDYKRGEFLVQMKKEQAKVGNDCGVELADNLPNALTLLPLIEDSSFREELSVRMYIPALEAMEKEFEASRIALKTKVRRKKQKVLIQEDMKNKNAYLFAISATLDVIREEFNIEKYVDNSVKADPLSSLIPSCESSCVTPAKTDKAVITD